MSKMEDLNDKVIVITGASAGIGAATALKFAEQGSKLALCGRNKENLERVAKECEEKGLVKSKVFVVTGDLKSEEDIQSVVSKITGHYPQIDVLINNAGVDVFGGIEQNSLEDFDDMYKIHIRAVVSLIQKFLPYLKKSKGTIINISSEDGIRPAPVTIAYSVMKAGMDHLTRCLAAELGPFQIRVNSINPSCIKTGIFVKSGFVKNEDESNELLERVGKTYPLRRVGEVEEVANVIVFMASSKASFVTGSNFVVDGGSTQTCGAF